MWRSVVLPGVLLGAAILGGIKFVRYQQGSAGVVSAEAQTGGATRENPKQNDQIFLDVYHSSHGYSVPGTVNGVRVSMLIDTGASNLAVPASLAQQAGISCTAHAQFSTAAGSISGCMGWAAEISFGQFRMQNVEVAILPRAQGVLLGMNVLRHYQMAWAGDRLRITRPVARGEEQQTAPTVSRPKSKAVPEWWKVKPDVRRTIGIGIVFVVLIGVVIAVGRRTGRQQAPSRPRVSSPYYNPKEFRSERRLHRPAVRDEDAYSRLCRACQGDAAVIDRLMEYERRRAPTVSDDEAAGRALSRLTRNRF